jgi:hypothetical protein
MLIRTGIETRLKAELKLSRISQNNVELKIFT